MLQVLPRSCDVSFKKYVYTTTGALSSPSLLEMYVCTYVCMWLGGCIFFNFPSSLLLPDCVVVGPVKTTKTLAN
jgi:hypothetical protein